MRLIRLFFFFHSLLFFLFLFSHTGIRSVLADTSFSSSLLVPVLPPDCDFSSSFVKIISSDADLSSLSNPSLRVFCITPGTYSEVTLTVSGTQSSPRFLRFFDSSHPTSPPWTLSASQRAVLRKLTFDADYWIVDGVAVSDTSYGIVKFSGAHNILNTALVENGYDMIRFTDGGDYNTVQNSVVRRSRRRPGVDSHCFIINTGKYNRILNNEISDCTDGIHLWDGGSENANNPAWSPEGTIIEGNEFYITPSLFADCGNSDANTSLTPNGKCACAENGIDIKVTTKKSNPELSDLTVIRNNLFYGFRKTHPTCGGSGGWGGALVVHYDPTYILIEQNVFFDIPRAIDVTDGNHITIRNNLISGIDDLGVGEGSIGFNLHFARYVEIYHNTLAHITGDRAYYIRHSDIASHNDIQNNAFILAGRDKPNNGGFPLSTLVGQNGFLDTLPFTHGMLPSTNTIGTLLDGTMTSFCMRLKKFTGSEQRCFSHVLPNASSNRLVGSALSSVGSTGDIGIDTAIGVGTDILRLSRDTHPDLGAFEFRGTVLPDTAGLSPTPTPADAGGGVLSPTPTVSATISLTPTPRITLVPTTIQFMGIKLGEFTKTPLQVLEEWIDVLLRVILP